MSKRRILAALFAVVAAFALTPAKAAEQAAPSAVATDAGLQSFQDASRQLAAIVAKAKLSPAGAPRGEAFPANGLPLILASHGRGGSSGVECDGFESGNCRQQPVGGHCFGGRNGTGEGFCALVGKTNGGSWRCVCVITRE